MAPRCTSSTTSSAARRCLPCTCRPSGRQAAGYPNSYVALHRYHDILCAEQAAAQGWSSGCATWTPASFGVDPSGTNEQKERTQAAYANLRFDFDDVKLPVDGNVGLRLVRTEMSAKGYASLTSTAPTLQPGQSFGGVTIPTVQTFSAPINFSQSYTDALPSLNLRLKASPDLQFRAALSRGLARPDFDKMQAYTTFSVSTQPHTTGTTVVSDRVDL